MLQVDFTKLEFDDETEERMFEFCRTHRLGLADIGDASGLKPKDFKFHVTVMYSKVTNPGFEQKSVSFSHVVEPVSFDMFGLARDLLVLRIRADDVLTDLFEHYASTYGHVSDFMPFRPHLTIRGNSAGAIPRLESMPLPDFELRATRIIQRVKTISL